MENEVEVINKLELLATKSKELLQEQLKSYEGANNKAGILISISALLAPIAISYISSHDISLSLKILIIIPTGLLILALIFLLKVLLPKGLDCGFNFNQFEKLLIKSQKEILLYEIGANRDSFKDNALIVKKQHENFRIGVKLIFFSALLLFILVIMSLFV